MKYLAGLLIFCTASPLWAAEGQIELRWSERLNDGAIHRTIEQRPLDQRSVEAIAKQQSHTIDTPIPLHSQSALVFDQETGALLLAKNAQMQTPIASITKLMTGVLVFDAHQDMEESITITADDRDTLKGTGSRLAIGSSYTRGQLLHLALIASDNRAAHALGRRQQLGMSNTVYVEPTGLNQANRSTATDLARLVNHAYQNYPEIRDISSSGRYTLGTQRVVVNKKHKSRVLYRTVAFNNTNRLTRENGWEIGLSKTGFINEAGHCLVMQARVAQKNVIIVLLDAVGGYRRVGDAARIKQWLESRPSSRLGEAQSTAIKNLM